MTTTLEGVRGQGHGPAALYRRERHGTHCTGGWVGPRAGLHRCGKSRPPPGFNPRTIQPVASRYTDYATRHTNNEVHIKIVVLHTNPDSKNKYTVLLLCISFLISCYKFRLKCHHQGAKTYRNKSV